MDHRTASNDCREKGLIRLGLVRKDFCRHASITGCFKGPVCVCVGLSGLGKDHFKMTLQVLWPAFHS